MKALPFAIAMLVPWAAISLVVDPSGWRLLVIPLLLFVGVPALDPILGRDRDEYEDAKANRVFRYDVFLWLWVPLQTAALIGAVIVVGQGELSSSTFLLAVLSLGIMTGLGINVGHELMHRRGAVERALAEVLLTQATYTHFCVEHVHGHHKHVATPADPASSRRGESLYAFLPRTLIGGLRSAWKIETERAQKQQLRWFSDRRVRYPVVVTAMYAGIYAAGGAGACAFFFLQSAVAVLLLEIINYVEHYGLRRREIEPGRYERCMPQHSWNASERLTNAFLFNLQRHADHHHLASRPFFALRHIDDSPQLPTGYAAMLLLACVPPLWFRVMNPRVDAWNDAWNERQQQKAVASSPASSAFLAA